MCERSESPPVTAPGMLPLVPYPLAATSTACKPLLPIDHYRLQLYNYAVQAERLRLHQQYSPYPGGYSPRLQALSMSLLHLQPEEPKPQHSYIGLIAMAILSSPDTKLVLSDIYQYILDHYPYFRSRGPGWRNSIRHNLSLNDCFVKAGRSANGKGHYWAIHPANVDDFRKGDFRRRKAQRKVRRHMGLAVDEDGTDSPSPPPVTPPAWPSAPGPAPIAFPYSVPRKRQFDVASLLAPDDDPPCTKRHCLSSDEEDIDVVKLPAAHSATHHAPTTVSPWFQPLAPVFAAGTAALLEPSLVARYYEQLAAQHHARRLQALQQIHRLQPPQDVTPEDNL